MTAVRPKTPWIWGLLLLSFLSQAQITNTSTDEETHYRPHFHFSPQSQWINDPNGMFYFNGTYHLFFQHHPYSNVWGPMHWGHAHSTDLLNWTEDPIALYPDALGTIFSGSAVVDHNNTSGFGTENQVPIVAIYTNHDPEGEKNGSIRFQTQSIAYSLDEGQTWTKYDHNPVIANPGIKDFRDPKVFWDTQNQQWVMALAAKDVVHFYRSTDLKNWGFLSEFGQNIGNHQGVWECPELFRLPVDGTDTQKWVLLVSINPGAPNGGSATQYFIGEWDGKTFVPDADFSHQMAQNHNFWLDFGKDNYASVSFDNHPRSDQKRIIIGWMSNWEYARDVPTQKWKNHMTLPRLLDVIPQGNSYRLRSQPIAAVRQKSISKKKWNALDIENSITLANTAELPLDRLLLSGDFAIPQEGILQFRMTSPSGDELRFGYNSDTNEFFLDRSQMQIPSFSESFAKTIQTAPRTATASNSSLKIVVDKTAIELFFDGGQTVLSALFFTKTPFDQIQLESISNKSTFSSLELFEIQP